MQSACSIWILARHLRPHENDHMQEPKIIGSQKAKQGRRGTRAFMILALGLVLAVIAFIWLMYFRPAGA